MAYGAERNANVAVYNPLPDLAASLYESPTHFHHLNATPNTGTIKNSCAYDVYVSSVGCGDTVQGVKIAAGSTWSEPLRGCDTGGVVYKIKKKQGDGKVMQFEAGVGSAKSNMQHLVWYDISFLDCMIQGTTDLSACAGWEGGIQAVAGPCCPVYVCGAGEYCDGSSYTVAEFGLTKDNQVERAKVGAPNSACEVSGGLAFELCAAKSAM